MKKRHKRIVFIAVSLAALGLGVTLVLRALNSNIAFFLSPSEVVAKQGVPDKTFRVGGLVETGSLKQESDGLTIHFAITDTVNRVPVTYKGIRPTLFKEGGGCVAQGRIGPDGVFHADLIMAKHDENYMPPEAGQAIDKAKATKSLVEK